MARAYTANGHSKICKKSNLRNVQRQTEGRHDDGRAKRYDVATWRELNQFAQEREVEREGKEVETTEGNRVDRHAF